MKHTSRYLFGTFLFIAGLYGQQLPPPTITSLLPNAVIAGSAGFTMRVEGTRFTQSSRVVWRFGGIGATTLTTTFINETLLSAIVPAGLLEQAGQLPVVVTQPGDAGATLTSNESLFSIFAGVTIPTSCPLPNAIVGRTYEAQFTPNGGVPPYTWSLAAGALPAGLALAPTGGVRGTPTAAGDFPFTVRVTDAQNGSATKACSLKSVASSEGQSVFITQIDPPGVLAGSAAQSLRIRGDGFGSSSIVVWNSGTSQATDLQTVWGGDPRFLTATVPQNLLSNPGTIPIAVRTVVLTRQTFSNTEPFIIAAPVQVTTSCPLRDATLRGSYSEQFTAIGGFPPYTWSITQGALPGGFSLGPSGSLSGAATEAGAFDITIAVADSRGNAGSKACSVRVLGPLSTAPSAINFVADAQGTPPPAQFLSVAGSASGLLFSAQGASEIGGGWLRVTTDSNRMPALVRVTAEPGGLGPGVYRGSVTISTDAATTRTTTVPVTLTVNNVRAANIEARPLAVRFAAGRGSGRLPWQAIQVANPGPGSVDFTIDTTAPWLTAAAERGVARNVQPAIVRLRASAEGLNPGTYRAALRLTPVGRAPVLVPVTLTVSLAPETLITAQSGLTFISVQGGPAPAAKPFHVLSTGSAGGFFWEASPSSPQGTRVLASVNPPSNASRPGVPSGSEVRADPEGLGAGLYFGDVRVTTASAENSPRLISTVLQVLPAQTAIPVELSSAGIQLTAPAGGATSTAQGVQVRNLSRSPVSVDFQLSGDARIFTSLGSGSRIIAPGESRRIEVRADVSTIGAGVHKAILYIQTSGDPQVRAVDVTLIATPVATRCNPSRLVASPITHPDGFQAPGALPSAIEFRVTDDCGEALNSGVFLVTPSTASGSAQLLPVGDGRWSGTWPVLQNTASPVSLNYFVEDPERSLQTSGSIAGTITPTNVPVVTEDAVVSAASFSRGAPVSTGGFISIFGTQLAEGRLSAASLPLPFNLGSTRVQLTDREAPLFFAGDQGSFSQINAIVPYLTVPNTIQQLAAWRGGLRSPYMDVAVAAAQPAVFTVTQSGGGQGIVVDGENPTVIAGPANPVARGKIVVIYCEGLGPVNPALIAGQAAPADPPAAARNPVAVTIGGQNATVLFAGLTPGLTGLYQVNAVVPESAPAGDAVPLVISVGGLTSEPVTIALR